MKGKSTYVITIVAFFGLVCLPPSVLANGTSDCGSTVRALELYEAQFLLSMTSEVQDAWKQFEDVRIVLNDEPDLNEGYYYVFVVRVATDSPSSLVGHFAVNKCTADVKDFVTDEFLQGKDLQVIQELVRRAHGIDDAIVHRFRNVPDVR